MSATARFFLTKYPTTGWIIVGNIALLLLVLAPVCVLVFHQLSFQWQVIWDYKMAFVRGWLNTIYISILSFFLSTLIGLGFALAKRSRARLLRYLAVLYIEVIRGTPLLVQILFFFYVIANSLGLENRYTVGIFSLSFFSGAYLAEIFRSGTESIRASQIESAKAIGLTKLQTLRFVTFPQALRVILPPLSGQFASLIKDSSLLSIIGIGEFTYTAQEINSTTYSTLESFLPLAIGYLLLTLPISLWSKFLEKSFRYET